MLASSGYGLSRREDYSPCPVQERACRPRDYRSISYPPMTGIYQKFTPPHFLILTGFGGITSALIVIRRRLPVKNARALDRALAAVAICTWTAYTICDAMPPRWNPAWSIPLHICDFAGLVAPIALWT